MGCGGSSVDAEGKAVEKVDNEQKRRTTRTNDRNQMIIRMKDTMGALNMSHSEIARFHEFVKSIDKNVDGHVSRDEFVAALDLHPKAMAKRLFEVMIVEHAEDAEHHKGKGKANVAPLHVAEFFVGIFHFSIRTGKHVHEDFFNIYSSRAVEAHGNKRHILQENDMELMLTDILGDGYDSKEGVEIKGGMDYHTFKHELPHQFDATREKVIKFRNKLEEKCMTTIFGSEGKWNRRKEEIVEILHERGFSGVGALFLRGLNEKLRSHDYATDASFDAAMGHGTSARGSGIGPRVDDGASEDKSMKEKQRHSGHHKHRHHHNNEAGGDSHRKSHHKQHHHHEEEEDERKRHSRHNKH